MSWSVGRIEFGRVGIGDWLVFHDFVSWDRSGPLLNLGEMGPIMDKTFSLTPSRFSVSGSGDLSWDDFGGDPCAGFSMYASYDFIAPIPPLGIGQAAFMPTTALSIDGAAFELFADFSRLPLFALLSSGGTIVSAGGFDAGRFTEWDPSSIQSYGNVLAMEWRIDDNTSSDRRWNGLGPGAATIDTTFGGGDFCAAANAYSGNFPSWHSEIQMLYGGFGSPDLPPPTGQGTPVYGHRGWAMARGGITPEKLAFFSSYPWGST